MEGRGRCCPAHRRGGCSEKPADPDGHSLINRSGADAVVLEVGDSDLARDACDYPDIDMIARPGEDRDRQATGRIM